MPERERQQRSARRAQVTEEPGARALSARGRRTANQAQLPEGLTGHLRNRHPFDLDAPVQSPHARDVDAATELGERRNRGRILGREPACDQRGSFVGRKESPVVYEHSKIVALDEPIRGVSIDDVDVPGVQRPVLHGGQERAPTPKTHPVCTRKTREPIRSTDEIRREPGSQTSPGPRGGGKGMPAKRVSGPLANRNGVRVLKT